jgi:hypothetical protein
MLKPVHLTLAICIVLCACQRAPESDNAAVNEAPAAVEPAVASNSTPVASTQANNATFGSEPFGIESCDAFLTAMNQCFATAKVHPGAIEVLRPGYEEHFKMLRRMKDKPNQASMLTMLCKSDMEKIAPEVKKGLQCD